MFDSFASMSNSHEHAARARRAGRVTLAYVIVAWLLLQMLDVVGGSLGLSDSVVRITVYAAIAGVPVALIAGYFLNIFPVSLEQVQQQRIRDFEEQVRAEVNFPEFFQRQLQLVAERARLLTVKASSRSHSLFWMGTILTVMSVFAPFVSISIYLNLEPLPQEVVDGIERLRGTDGNLPSGIDVSIAKDWRVLVSGISFGFLFLAAAGALFAQYRRQMEIVFQLGKDVDYFDAVVSAAEIRQRANKENLDLRMSDLVDDVIKMLLNRNSRNGEADGDRSHRNTEEPDALSKIADSVSTLKSEFAKDSDSRKGN
ncbi:MAG: hypothetical protein QNI99_16055 [Woeseiaceae bacterium]|nr:hypothetical protein [Woeseiaceae bacterium]